MNQPSLVDLIQLQHNKPSSRGGHWGRLGHNNHNTPVQCPETVRPPWLSSSVFTSVLTISVTLYERKRQQAAGSSSPVYRVSGEWDRKWRLCCPSPARLQLSRQLAAWGRQSASPMTGTLNTRTDRHTHTSRLYVTKNIAHTEPLNSSPRDLVSQWNSALAVITCEAPRLVTG